MSKADQSASWVLAVYVLLRDSKGRVLLLRRSHVRGHFPGCWELPGGKPAPGEAIDTTARLEVSEESDLPVRFTGVAGAVEGSIPGVRVAMLILEGRTRSTKVKLSDEHDDFCWLPLNEVGSLKLRPGFDRFFADYARQNRSKAAKRSAKKEPRRPAASARANKR